MYRLLAILVLLGAAFAQQNNGDLESIIHSIFGPPNSTTGQNTGGTGQNTGGTGQNTGGTGQSTGGTGQNTGGTGQNTGGTGQNQDGFTDNKGGNIPTTILGPSTIVPPPGISDITNDTSCTTEKNEVGECVRYYLCNGNNTVIDDGVGIIDIRVRDGPCPSYMDTCCLLDDQRATTDPITPAPPLMPKNEGCGYRNPEGVDMRIIGDNDGESKFGEFPWMVAILKIEPVNENDPEGQKLNVYVGGGSLIHPSVVLTAAHYVAAAKKLRVRAGEWDTQTTKEIHPYQDRDVDTVEIHKDFNKGNLFYDIALLFLATPMDPAPNVGVVCLPPPRESVTGGTRCFSSGWGKDKFGKEGRFQVILKKVDVPVVERRSCQESLRKTRLGRFFELHTSFMCAGGEPGRDTCKGDGGSPLVCPIEFDQDRYMQSGIVAWGIGCGEDGTPGVYVDVANLRTWIDDKVKGRGYPINGYSYTV